MTTAEAEELTAEQVAVLQGIFESDETLLELLPKNERDEYLKAQKSVVDARRQAEARAGSNLFC